LHRSMQKAIVICIAETAALSARFPGVSGCLPRWGFLHTEEWLLRESTRYDQSCSSGRACCSPPVVGSRQILPLCGLGPSAHCVGLSLAAAIHWHDERSISSIGVARSSWRPIGAYSVLAGSLAPSPACSRTSTPCPWLSCWRPSGPLGYSVDRLGDRPGYGAGGGHICARAHVYISPSTDEEDLENLAKTGRNPFVNHSRAAPEFRGKLPPIQVLTFRNPAWPLSTADYGSRAGLEDRPQSPKWRC
jgi:hypothetical protein